MSKVGMRRETLDARKLAARHETIAESRVSRLTPHRVSGLTYRDPWPRVKLGAIGKVVTGMTPPTKHQAYYGDDYLFVTPSDLDFDSYFISKTERCISQQGCEKYYNRFIPAMSTMYTCIGSTISKIGLSRGTVLTNQQINSIIPNEAHDARFVYYLMRSLTTEIRALNAGCAVPIINKGDFENIDVPLVPLPVQRRIADILSAYDDLIENNRRRIAILEETARLTYRKWFVERHFPGHERVLIEDGIPLGWEKVHLGDCVVTNLQSYRATELPSQINYIDISSVKEGKILEKKHLFSHEAPGRARRRARSGDVIWSNVRPNLKSYALILEPEVDDVFSTGFTILTPKSIPYSFLYFFVSTDEFVSYLDNMVTGATYPAVRPGDFEQAELLLPNRELLTRFHTLFEPLLWQCEVLVRQNAVLATARDMLLPRLMKGEIEL